MAALTTARRARSGAIPGQSARAAARKSMVALRIGPEMQPGWGRRVHRWESGDAAKRWTAARRDASTTFRADSASLAAHTELQHVPALLASVLQDASLENQTRGRGWTILPVIVLADSPSKRCLWSDMQRRFIHRRPPARSNSCQHSKSPHRRYTHEDDADSKVPSLIGSGTRESNKSSDARGRSASSLRARDTSTGSPGRRGGTRTLPDTTGITACGRVPGHRDCVQYSRAVSRSGCFERRPATPRRARDPRATRRRRLSSTCVPRDPAPAPRPAGSSPRVSCTFICGPNCGQSPDSRAVFAFNAPGFRVNYSLPCQNRNAEQGLRLNSALK